MYIEQVSTAYDFIAFDRGLLEMASSCRRSLEVYLSALLRSVSRLRDQQPTWNLLALTLAWAFEDTPQNFNRAWLLQTEPPASVAQPGNMRTDSFEDLVQLLRFQIADLHRMAQSGKFEEPICEDGIESLTGHRWFNFNPASFLESAANAMSQYPANGTCSWRELMTFLWLGQTRH